MYLFRILISDTMKKHTAIFFITILFILGCNSDPRAKMPQTGEFGIAFTENEPKSVSDVIHLLDSGNNIPIQVSGVISNYCKGEGCWLTLKNENGEDLLIEIDSQAFVLPLHIENKTALVNGIAIKELEGDKKLSVHASGILIK